MPISYLLILFFIFILTLLLDILISKVLFRHLFKLLLTLSFIYGVFMLMDYAGIYLKLWQFDGDGLQKIYIFGLPIEEYVFMAITPYTAIVIWESFHRIMKRR